MTTRSISRLLFAAMVLAATGATPALATNSPIELRTQAQRLVDLLTGEFDSEPQRFFEQESATPLELIHSRVYRVFTRVSLPALGDQVLFVQVRSGGREGRPDPIETLLWTISVDETRRAIRMSPRAIRDVERYFGAENDPARLATLQPASTAPPGAPGACDIWWRLEGRQLVGRTDPEACRGPLRPGGAVLAWSWEWVLADEELWINFAGRAPDGALAFGRPDQTHWRLGKARRFECFLAYQPQVGERQVVDGLSLHDRGDVHRWNVRNGERSLPLFLQLNRGMWPSNSGRNYTDLLRLDVYEGRPEDAPEKWIRIGGSIASAASDRAGFMTPELSGRCDLPSAPQPRP